MASSGSIRTDLDLLTGISRRYGGDITFIVAGGGNTSVKTGDILYIKPSGTTLATITPEDFVPMDRARLSMIIEKASGLDEVERERCFLAEVMAARRPGVDKRPSVEVVLHNLLSEKYVVHTHPTMVNLVTCCTKGRERAEELFGDEVLWVPYVDPGCVLAKQVQELIAAYEKAHGREPEAILLENHGLFVQARNPERILEITESLVRRIESRLSIAAGAQEGDVDESSSNPTQFASNEAVEGLRTRLEPILAAVSEELSNAAVVYSRAKRTMATLLDDKAQDMVMQGPLTPDQIVYCKRYPLWLPSCELSDEDIRQRIENHIKAYNTYPRVILLGQGALFAAGPTQKAAETSRLVYEDALQVMRGASLLGGIGFMKPRDAAFIDNWEIENYRRQVAAGDDGRSE